MQRKSLGIINVDFNATSQLLIIYSASVILQKKKWEYNEAVGQSYTDFKSAYDSVRWEVFCNILTEFGIPMKLKRLRRMYLNVTYNRVRVGNHLSDMLLIKNGLKKTDAF